MIETVNFIPSDQVNRTKLFDSTVEETLEHIKKIKTRYKSSKPMSEYACRYALNTVKLREFEDIAQNGLFLPNVHDEVVSLPDSEINPNSDRYAFLPIEPGDRTEYVIDGSFAAMSAQQEMAAKEYFDTNETDSSFEEELADNAEFLKENPDQIWPLSVRLGIFSTLTAVNYATLEALGDDDTNLAAVWRGRPIMSMTVRPVLAPGMLYHCLAHANQVNDNPYTDLTSKGARRKQHAMLGQNENEAQWSEGQFQGAYRETAPKKLAKIQYITAAFTECKPDNSPSRLW